MLRTLATLLLLLLTGFSACASDLDIHSMVVGDRALELVEDRQLTFHEDGEVTSATMSPNGKYVAYTTCNNAGLVKLCIKNLGNGNVRTLADESVKDANGVPWGAGGINWSPDSKTLVFSVSPNANPYPHDSTLVVATPAGHILSSIPCPKSTTFVSKFHWSPDLHKITAELKHYTSNTFENEGFNIDIADLNKDISIGIVDLTAGTVKSVTPMQPGPLVLRGWEDDSTIIYARSNGKSHNLQYRRLYIDSRPEEVLQQEYIGDEKSYDGVLVVKSAKEKLEIARADNQEIVRTVDVPYSNFVGWAPNSRLFLYYGKQVTVEDENKLRRKTLTPLWLASVGSHKLNHMCVAMDMDDPEAWDRFSWSSDCSKLAYVSNGRLHVVQFSWREPNAGEKVEAGIKLTESEEKQLIAENGRGIRTGIEQYQMDHKGALPTGKAELMPYITKKLLQRPGTEHDIFTLQQIESTADSQDAVLGVLDAGYDWKVVIRLNGDVDAVSK